MAQNMVLTYLHFRIHWLKLGFPTSPEALGHVPDFARDAGRRYMAMVGKPKHVIGQSKGNMKNMWEQYWKNRETWKHMGKTWSERPQEPCTVCDSQCLLHHKFLTFCEKTQGFFNMYYVDRGYADEQKRRTARLKWLILFKLTVFFNVFAFVFQTIFSGNLFFLPFIPVVLAQLSEPGEHVSFIEATPLSTPEVFPESSPSDLPFGSRCPLFRHTFLFMVPLPIQLLRARGASSTSFARELCMGVFDHNPFESFARPVFSSFLPSVDVARCPA